MGNFTSALLGKVQAALTRDLRRRSAIEPTIGHMKTDGRLARSPLKGTAGDALHAVLCGCGHNIRLILAHLKVFVAEILRRILHTIAAEAAATRPADTQTALAA